MPQSSDETPLSRRSILGAGVASTAATAAALLSGCGDESGPDARTPGAGDASSSPPTTSVPSPSSPSSAAAGPLVRLSEVPVGGAVVVTAADGVTLVVAQPTLGRAVAFSASCTHANCTVRPVGTTLDCPCHGSTFDAFSGARRGGPARHPLPPVPVTVRDGAVWQA